MEMSGNDAAPGRPPGVAERWMSGVVRWLALGGGAILCAVVLLIVVNVVLRRIFNAPIEGEYEMAELVIGAAAFAFFPYCQWHGGNIRVDLLIERLPPAAGRALEILAQILFTAVAVILAWRLTIGTEESFAGGEETQMLRIPVGWGYLGVAIFAGVLAFTSLIQTVLVIRGRRP